MDKNPLSFEAQRIRMAEDLWLRYFNKTLFEQGLITEAERNQMAHRIATRNPSTIPTLSQPPS